MIVPNETWDEQYIPGEPAAYIPDRTMYVSPEGDVLLLFGAGLPDHGLMARQVCPTHDIWAVATLQGHVQVFVERAPAWRWLVDNSYE